MMMASEHMTADKVPGVHAKPSPSGGSIAFVKDRTLHASRIPQVHLANINAPIDLRIADVISLQWNPDESRILIVSSDGAEIVDRAVSERKTAYKLSNGSGGLGRFFSVDFLSNHRLLSVSEFGKARIWDLESSSNDELPDFKTTCNSKAWTIRPPRAKTDSILLAFISKTGPDEQLNLFFPDHVASLSSTKLPTTDAQGLVWSPDGRWLVVQDTATACPFLHVYTPDGHLFRSYPSREASVEGLGPKSIAWSPDSRSLALAQYDGKIELLNSRTFSVLAAFEHTLTIDQCSLPVGQRASIWEETVSASEVRTFNLASQPVSPPLSQRKPNPELTELGVTEQRFNCDGSFLASRDCRMLNTVWIWNTAAVSLHAVLIQHKDVRRLLWHPTRPSVLLVDCAEEVTYLFDTTSSNPPRLLNTGLKPTAVLSWVRTLPDAKPVILGAEKQGFRLIYPEGEPDRMQDTMRLNDTDISFDEGVSEDSLFDILSSRKPLPPKTEPSYTEMVDLEMDAEDTAGIGLDDTFRDKKKAVTARTEVDPLDDSDIF